MARASKGWLGKAIDELQFTAAWAIVQKLGAAALPTIMAGVAVVTGYLEGLPITYILTCITVVFAMTALGMISVSLFVYFKSPEHKFKVLNTNFDWYGKQDENGNFVGLISGRIFITFQNMSPFPLSIIVEKFDCSIEGRIPKLKTNRGNPLRLQAQSSGYFYDDQIDLSEMPLRNLDGLLYFKILYGQPGKEKYVSEDNVRLVAVYNQIDATYAVRTSIIDSKASFGA